MLGAWATVCAVVRDTLLRSGIDPACARALSQAGGSLAGLGDTPEFPRAGADRQSSRSPRDGAPRGGALKDGATEDGATEPPGEPADPDPDGAAGLFAVRIGDTARQFQTGGGAPDFANASLAELFAWCLARGANAGIALGAADRRQGE